mmetsp:Transcript_5680/g.19129  ORF Transcript_5680/g.19129 Transcript_5680/m.19129 type:complete len:271 (-) Transcript_5680:510-1322(-)
MRIFGNLRSLGTHSTRDAKPPVAAVGPCPSRPISIDAAYPRSRQFLRTIPTTLPVGTTPAALVFATTASVSSAVSGAKPPTSAAASLSLSSSFVPVTSLAPGRIHSDSGNISIATMSPSMARFNAARPLNKMLSPVDSFTMCASQGLYLDVRTPPFTSTPRAKPSLIALALRCSSNTAPAPEDALAPPPPRARLVSRSSGMSAPPPGTTKSFNAALSSALHPSPFVVMTKEIHSSTDMTSMSSSRAFLAFPRSFVTRMIFSHALRGTTRR